MPAADKRVDELLNRWLASVDLHLGYLKLDDSAYARVEAWPKHQRPNALVVNLARARLLELKSQLGARRDAGDMKFAESLELMSFLTSLLGSEHIERFIPLANGQPSVAGQSGTVEQPPVRTTAKTAPAAKTGDGARPRAATKAAPAGTTAPRAARATVSRQPVGARSRPVPSAAAPAAPASPSPPASPPPPLQDAVTQQVIADAIRMLEWGREWPAIAGLIGRMAGRPSETEIWKILRAYRSDILAKARRTG